MVRPSYLMSGMAAAGTAGAATCGGPRYAMYFDQYHTTDLPNKTLTAGITHVITAFANSSLFASNPAGTYTPFMSLSDIKPMFDNGTKYCMAIGGWGDTEGFRQGMATGESRTLYAKNIADTLDRLGYDCVDIDLEYPGGNGYDYKQVPNSKLTSEIENFPLLLSSIKFAIGRKELSVAVPALERDMIAYTAEKVPLIDAAVDAINVMSYDLLNRRDTVTKHHTDVNGSLNAIDLYIARGATPAKLQLGFAYYAKYFTLAPNTTCTGPLGCPLALAEAADGSDTGTSGAVTFEASSFPVAVNKSALTPSPDTSCGKGTTYMCPDNGCCSQYGWCGNTSAHCGTGCQSGFGTCAAAAGKSTAQSFADALENGKTDTENGGQWWVDSEAGLFWSWDTPDLMAKKFNDIIKTRGLGGVFGWSLAEDSHDWSHLLAMQSGVAALKSANKFANKTANRKIHWTHL